MKSCLPFSFLICEKEITFIPHYVVWELGWITGAHSAASSMWYTRIEWKLLFFIINFI